MHRYTTDVDGLDAAARTLTSGANATEGLPAAVAAALHSAGDGAGDAACGEALHDLARQWRRELIELAGEQAVFGVRTGSAARAYGDADAQVRSTMWDPT